MRPLDEAEAGTPTPSTESAECCHGVTERRPRRVLVSIDRGLALL